MVFATKAFWVFLPVVLLLYHASAGRTRKYAVLLAASWLFYAWLSPQYLWVIVALTAVDYIAGVRIEDAPTDRAKRRWLALSIAANLGLLAAFKYLGFAYDNAASLTRLCGLAVADRTWDILLPLGISFHTFQGISYTVDVYRGHIRAVRRPLDYALFVAFFPQLAAGPIVRAVEFLPQMTTPPPVTAQRAADGLHFLLLGLFKKLVIADHLDAVLVSPVFADPGAFGPAAHRWACLAWAAQLYCDFSGYSDIAVGLAKWFGFDLPRNFAFPYLATSVPDFWRRWHLSLSTWLRDYLYFPLGGSRGGDGRACANLLLVFVGVRAMLTMIFYEDAEELAHMGYSATHQTRFDRTRAKRQLPVLAAVPVPLESGVRLKEGREEAASLADESGEHATTARPAAEDVA